MIDLVVTAAAVGLWLLVYAVCRLLTRPAAPPAAPATMELGPESPALVSLLVNRWTLTEDAAESTLFDLAARKFFELRQPGDDPMQTTAHLPARPPDASGLRPYESQVLERIRGLAVGGVVPISALTFRNEGQAKTWNKRLRASVIAEARTAGLSRRRFGPAIVALLVVVAAIAGVAVGLAALHYGIGKADDDKPGFGAGLVVFFLLSALGGRALGERDTAAGRAAAARWLGVRDWLRGHEQFAELPPAAVAVWDRYLGYGAAVGATRLASAVLDLEMGNRRLVWSSFGGTWHRVRVRYPQFWPRYGRPLPHLLLRGGAYTLAGGLVVKLIGRGDRLAIPGILLLILGAYVLVRAVLDLATTRTVTGEVLWQETWKSTGGSDDTPATPWLDYLAIDDGTGDRTTAWGLPSEWGGSCHDGDTVTIAVRPWSRRIGELTQVGQGRSRQLIETVTADDTGSLALQMLQPGNAAAPSAPVFRAADLFTVDEVSRVVGRPVLAEPMVMGLQFRAAEGGKALLLVQTVSGLPGRVAWRANSRGEQLPGFPGGACVNGDRAAFRQGDTTVVLTLLGDGRQGRAHLPWLLGQAGARTE
jgi:predicted membrane protein DUF2207